MINGILSLLFFVLIFAVILLVISALIMVVWNVTIPSIFAGAPVIDIVQAFGLFVLAQLLTSGTIASSSK